MTDYEMCWHCESKNNVLQLSVDSRTFCLCMSCYQELEHFNKMLRLSDRLNMSNAGTWGARGLPRPYRQRAQNNHDWAMLLTEHDEQTTSGQMACIKCGGRWTVLDKHQARFLTEFDECVGNTE